MARRKKKRERGKWWEAPKGWSWTDPLNTEIKAVKHISSNIDKSLQLPKGFLFSLLLLIGIIFIWINLKGETRKI